jgi:hypothetical protein
MAVRQAERMNRRAFVAEHLQRVETASLDLTPTFRMTWATTQEYRVIRKTIINPISLFSRRKNRSSQQALPRYSSSRYKEVDRGRSA